MIQKDISVRDYKFSDAALKQKADGIIITIQRDINEFNLRAINAATLSALQTMIATFSDTPTDEELMGAMAIATAYKDGCADKLRIALRTVRTMAQNKWGVTNAFYHAFAFDAMDEMSDEELFRLGKRVIRVATLQLSDLLSEGLTMIVINKLITANNQFDNAIDAQLDAINSRDIQTQDRINKGNALYKEVLRLANTGKDIFISTDEAKYNDYVVYEVVHHSEPISPPVQ